MMKKIEVSIVAMAESQSKSGHFVMILEDPKSKLRVPIIIGTAEAQAIAMPIEKIFPQRPLTHDLFHNVLNQLQTKLKEVIINAFENDIFHAILIFQDTKGSIIQVDARPSDAVALAIRFNCQIYIDAFVLETCGYAIDEKSREKKGSYAEYTLAELEELLEKILKKEDYESATRVRDAIERRKGLK